jgi:ABC-type transporter Mla MlaB component
MSVSSIEVSEIQGRLHPAAESAAMRYAGGYAAEARRALEQGLAQFPEERRLWLMLLDLHRVEGHWKDYEAVVADYRRHFGQDPAPERERHEQEARLPEALRTGGKACWALGGLLDASAVGTLARLREAAGHHTVVHLDLSRLSGVDPAGCRLLADTLDQLIAAGNGIVLSGDRLLGRLLREAVETDPTRRPYWELMLTLLRFAQDRHGFDRTALEYALAADVPAPAWEPLIMPQPQWILPGERRNEPRYAPREQFALTGTADRPGRLRARARVPQSGPVAARPGRFRLRGTARQCHRLVHPRRQDHPSDPAQPAGGRTLRALESRRSRLHRSPFGVVRRSGVRVPWPSFTAPPSFPPAAATGSPWAATAR